MDSKERKKRSKNEWGGTTRDYILFPAGKKKVKRKKEGEFFGCGFLQYDTVM